MIIGVFKREVLSKTIPNSECPNCKAQNAVRITVSHEFFNLGLPWFPTAKKFRLNCDQCKIALGYNNVPAKLNTTAWKIAKSTKYSPWMYLMLIIIAFMLPIVLIKTYNTHKDNLKKIESPKVGDSYEIEVYKDSYTIYKVVKHTSDSVYMVRANFETDLRGISDMHKADESMFSDEIQGFSKKDLEIMNSQDKINGIESEK